MLARITKVEEHIVKVEDDEDNPLDLSNGLRWFMVDAIEERSRTSPRQVGRGTVSSSNVKPTL
jgi:Autophagy-related protein 11